MAPPRVVDYQPETDGLALLQTLGGEAEEEEDDEEEEGEEEEDADMLETARRRQVRQGCGRCVGGADVCKCGCCRLHHCSHASREAMLLWLGGSLLTACLLPALSICLLPAGG